MKKNNRKSNFPSNGGFTLVELLIVVVTIGILSAFAVPRYLEAVQNAQLSKQKASISAIEKAKDQKILADFKNTPATDYITTFNSVATDQKLVFLSEYLVQNGITPTVDGILKGTGRTSLNVGTMTNNGSQRMTASFQ